MSLFASFCCRPIRWHRHRGTRLGLIVTQMWDYTCRERGVHRGARWPVSCRCGTRTQVFGSPASSSSTAPLSLRSMSIYWACPLTASSHSLPTTALKGSCSVLVWQTPKPRLKEVQQLAPGHLVCMWQSLDSNPDITDSRVSLDILNPVLDISIDNNSFTSQSLFIV